MIGDERIKELMNIIYHETDRFQNIEKVKLLIYLIDREFNNKYNHKATGISWIKDRKPRTNRINSSIISHTDGSLYHYFDGDDKELVKSVIHKYSDYSLEELREECKDENYKKANRNSVISFY